MNLIAAIVARVLLYRRCPVIKQTSLTHMPLASWSEVCAVSDVVPLTLLTTSSTEVRGFCYSRSVATFLAERGVNNPTGCRRVLSLAYVA